MLLVDRTPFSQTVPAGFPWCHNVLRGHNLKSSLNPARYFAFSSNIKPYLKQQKNNVKPYVKRPKRCPGSRLTDMPKGKEQSAGKTTHSSITESNSTSAATPTINNNSRGAPGRATPQKADLAGEKRGQQLSVAGQSSHIADSCAVALGLPSSEASSCTLAQPASQNKPGSSDAVVIAAKANTASTRSNIGPAASENSAYAQAYIQKRKRQLVDSLMAVIQEWLDHQLGPLEEAQDGGDNESAGGSKRSNRASTSSSNGSGRPLAGQKRQLRHNEKSETRGDEDDQNGPDRISKRSKKDSDDSRQKFACPYYKRDPVKHNHRNCCGPGWDTVHRVKEHLYRRHGLPSSQCFRCRERFKTNIELEEHQRSETSCCLRDSFIPDPIEGFDKEKETKLRARTNGKKTEIEKWYEMYRILFDLSDDAEMPSPFYDHAENSQGHKENVAIAQMEEKYGKSYMNFIRRELPQTIRREIEINVDREFGDCEVNMRSKIFQFISDAHLKLFRNFQSIRSPDDAASMDDPNVSMPPLRARSQSPEVVVVADTLPPAAPSSFTTTTIHEFGPWDFLAEAESVWEEFDRSIGTTGGPSFDACEARIFYDSAYYSNGSGSDTSAIAHHQSLEHISFV